MSEGTNRSLPKVIQMPPDESFLQFAGTTVVKAEPLHAVAEQGHDPELENHAGARHAGALFSVGYAASRALVAAALARRPVSQAQLADCQVAYEKVVSEGIVTASAEPAAENWQTLLERASEGEHVLLPTIVMLRNDRGQTVTTMNISWNVGSAGGSPA